MIEQAVHILKKDVRGLWPEIGLLLLTLGAIVALDGYWIYPVWMPAGAVAAFLVVRLVHFEPFSGEGLFWATRPYRPGALISAKLAFIVLFVSLPVALAQLLLFTTRDGFSVARHLDGIVWSTVMVFLVVLVPLAALASLTRNGVEFVMALSGTALGTVLARTITVAMPGEVVWIRNGIAVAILATTAAVVLGVQYFSRRPLHAMAIGIVGIAGALGTGTLLAPASILAVQAAAGPRAFDPATVEVTPVLDEIRAERSLRPFRNDILLRVAFRATGAPGGVTLRKDWSVGSATFGGGGRVDLDQNSPQGWTQTARVPASVFDTPGTRITVRATFWMTALGDAQSTVLGPSEVATVGDGIECRRQPAVTADGSTPSDEIRCRRPFSWGRHALTGSSVDDVFVRPPSTYSPFPSGLDLNAFVALEQRMPAGGTIELVTRRPVAHFRRDVEFTIDPGAIAIGDRVFRSNAEDDVSGEEAEP